MTRRCVSLALAGLVAFAFFAIATSSAYAWTNDTHWTDWHYLGSADASAGTGAFFADLAAADNAWTYYENTFVDKSKLWMHFDETYPAATGSRVVSRYDQTASFGNWAASPSSLETHGRTAELRDWGADNYLLAVQLDAFSRQGDNDVDKWSKTMVPWVVWRFVSTAGGENQSNANANATLSSTVYPQLERQVGVARFAYKRRAGTTTYDWTLARGYQMRDGTDLASWREVITTGTVTGSVPAVPDLALLWSFDSLRVTDDAGNPKESHDATLSLAYGMIGGETDDAAIVSSFMASPDATTTARVPGVDPSETPTESADVTATLPPFIRDLPGVGALWGNVQAWFQGLLDGAVEPLQPLLWPLDLFDRMKGASGA